MKLRKKKRTENIYFIFHDKKKQIFKLRTLKTICDPTRSHCRLSECERSAWRECADENSVVFLVPVIADTLRHPGSLSGPHYCGLLHVAIQGSLWCIDMFIDNFLINCLTIYLPTILPSKILFCCISNKR